VARSARVSGVAARFGGSGVTGLIGCAGSTMATVGAPTQSVLSAPTLGSGPPHGLGALLAPRRGYLVCPLYDGIFFCCSPLLGVAAALAASRWPTGQNEVELFGRSRALESLLLASFVHAHLVLVFLRSHLNRDVFRTHPMRFLLAPPLLFSCLLLSARLRAAAVLLAVFWDIYHSAQQSFGLGRIYDRLQGNDLQAGRSLDRWLNHLVYTGPALAGLGLLPQLVAQGASFDALGRALFADSLAYGRVWRPWLAAALIGGGVPFVAFYLWSYWRLARTGYRVSTPKVVLLASTALCSIWTWSLDPFGRAFLVNNFFHALQYFGLVAWTERTRTAPLAGRRGPELARSLGVICAFGFGYGVLAATAGAPIIAAPWSVAGVAFSVTVCVSLLHFWYDGFVWSVRRGQV
jgi:hypothetical protein